MDATLNSKRLSGRIYSAFINQNSFFMKKFLLTAIGLVTAIFLLFSLQGCLKDRYAKTYSYTYYLPVYKTTQEVRSNIKSNAAQPIQQPGKIYIKGQYIFLNDIDKGIHIIDNSNPSQPQNIAFIDIPGNMDLAVKGNTLYADLYTDLVAIDISNPHHVTLKKVVEGVFPERYYTYFRPDSLKVIASWEKRDTTITERGSLDNLLKSGRVFMDYAALSSSQGSGKSTSVSPYGVGGSMARFAVVSQRLYTVGSSRLDIFNISNTNDPFNVNNKNLGQNIETIYPFEDKLFIGSQTGMLVYDISLADYPVQIGQFSHVASCDPVISDGEYAYVTLRSGTTCWRSINELDILKLTSFTDPLLVKTYSMTNPRGLSKDGTALFICDGKDGLKIYDATNLSNLQLMKTIAVPETYDVITMSGRAILVAKDGLYQYDYTDLNNVRLLSKITLQN